MDFSSYFAKVDEARKWLEGKVPFKPKIVVVLSGELKGFEKGLSDVVELSSADIPNFPRPSAEGHNGRVVFGKQGGAPLAVFSGRCHYYEGYPVQMIVFPVFVMSALGAKILITTNAVGGINDKFRPGDVMMIEDHINFMGTNPLIGLATQKKEAQFASLTNAYDEGLRALARGVAKRMKFDLKEGVFVACSGPSYETKAEIRAYRMLGADAVGMSTVPEVIAANFLGMKALSFSCIANKAADLHGGQMSHAEVLDAMAKLAPKAVEFLKEVVGEISKCMNF